MLFGEALYYNYFFEVLTLYEQCKGDDMYFYETSSELISWDLAEKRVLM